MSDSTAVFAILMKFILIESKNCPIIGEKTVTDILGGFLAISKIRKINEKKAFVLPWK